MDRLPGAVSLARALLTLERSGRSGVLEVISGAERCRIAVRAGTPVAATPLRRDGTLGDSLLRSGDLDLRRHDEALAESPPTGPVGDWLVATGAATRPAVELALRNQLRARVLHVFRFRGLEYRFEPGATDVGVHEVAEPVDGRDLVLDALRAALAGYDDEQLASIVRTGYLRLSPLGTALLERAALWPSEAAMATLLQRGAHVARLRRATGDCPRALRTLAALRLLHAVEGRHGGEARYALLAQKRRQLRRESAPNVLLDLPQDAGPADARRALRRLAQELHPDRIDPDAPAAVHQASTEVMGALIRAEASLRRRAPAQG